MLITSKDPRRIPREIELRQKALNYRMPEIEPILWREKVETVILVSKCATMRSLSDIRLSRVKWVEKPL